MGKVRRAASASKKKPAPTQPGPIHPAAWHCAPLRIDDATRIEADAARVEREWMELQHLRVSASARAYATRADRDSTIATLLEVVERAEERRRRGEDDAGLLEIRAPLDRYLDHERMERRAPALAAYRGGQERARRIRALVDLLAPSRAQAARAARRDGADGGRASATLAATALVGQAKLIGLSGDQRTRDGGQTVDLEVEAVAKSLLVGDDDRVVLARVLVAAGMARKAADNAVRTALATRTDRRKRARRRV